MNTLKRLSFQHLDDLPLYEEEFVRELGNTLVVAPHPDDESLGCGGLLALLSRYRQPVTVLFVSDGAASHPHSIAYPPTRLAALRQREALNALNVLGVPESCAIFMNLPDAAVPRRGEQGFTEAVATMRHHIRRVRPRTLVMPWRRDPHSDHRAARELSYETVKGTDIFPRLLEYPIWSRITLSEEDWPSAEEIAAWRVNTSSVQQIKLHAITAHESQVSDLINDDPHGFRLRPSMLVPFLKSYEVFLESPR